MPWTAKKDGLQTRFQLSGGWGVGGVLATLLGLGFLGVFGPGFLAVGSLVVSVSCERAEGGPAADCAVTEGFLFGLVPYRHAVAGATGVGYATSKDPRRTTTTTTSRLTLETAAGAQPLTTLASNMNSDGKREVKRALDAYFAGTERHLALRVSFYNGFALFGLPFALLWLFLLWGLLTAPLGLFWRAGIQVDPMARVLRVRTKPGPRPQRQVPLGDLAALEVSPNPGGWLGNLASKAPAPRGGKSPGLHLHLVLHSGERIVLRNFFKIPDEEMHALGRALSEATGAPAQ